MDRSRIIRLADAQARIPGPAGEHATEMLQRGTMKLKLSMPVPPNVQTPHEQDELYVILRGHGILFHDGKRDSVAAGDAIFIAAGIEHHFEDFTKELAVWVIFYGPSGGDN